jgi:hypothetical protein
MNPLLLFMGWHPEQIFFDKVSTDFAELVIVFGTIAATLAVMVMIGNWWSR